MSIDPMKSGSVNPQGGPRLDQAGGNQSARQSGQAQRAPGEIRENDGEGDDQVQLSARARSVGSTSGTSDSGLSAERLQEILKRLTSGYYDSAQVQDRVAQRVKDELAGPGPVA
jgi:hypothetical protein